MTYYRPLDLVLTTMAGDLAQMHAYPRSRRGHDIDRRLTYDAVSRLDGDTDEIMRWALRCAADILSRRWYDVEAVAPCCFGRR